MYDYEQVLEIIENSRRFGNRPGVEVTAVMLEKLGNPQRGLPFIHVAGTNGKGSVCAFLNRIFMEAGWKVGLFTSPHLINFRERIKVNDQMITKADVMRLGNRILTVDYGVNATMFDYCLLMAVLYFQEQNCDLAIIETGLGGRLDSTNALGLPEVAVITRIGYDHMAVLGETLAEIAEEKAGILKPGAPAVFAPQESEALAVLKKHQEGICVSSADLKKVAEMKEDLLGTYQLENAAAAMLAAEILLKKEQVPNIQQVIRRGLKKTYWPGRMEVLSEAPYFMVDGAHNSNGIHALKTSLIVRYPSEKFHFVMGVMADKDYENMIVELLPLAIDFVTVTPDCERALQAEQLAQQIKERGIPAKSVKNVRDVLMLPVEGEKTIALGSLYFIGELKALWRERNGVSISD